MSQFQGFATLVLPKFPPCVSRTPWSPEWRFVTDFRDEGLKSTSRGTGWWGPHRGHPGSTPYSVSSTGKPPSPLFWTGVGVPRLRRSHVSRSRHPHINGGGSKVSYGISRSPGSVSDRCPHLNDVSRGWSCHRLPRHPRSSGVSWGWNCYRSPRHPSPRRRFWGFIITYVESDLLGVRGLSLDRLVPYPDGPQNPWFGTRLNRPFVLYFSSI